jgi:hypothetical protein
MHAEGEQRMSQPPTHPGLDHVEQYGDAFQLGQLHGVHLPQHTAGGDGHGAHPAGVIAKVQRVTVPLHPENAGVGCRGR